LVKTLVVDDAGFAKDGGVAVRYQQYSGTIGKIGNC
jgi:SRSO17 transposase